jgi:hypothetical protein
MRDGQGKGISTSFSFRKRFHATHERPQSENAGRDTEKNAV